MTRDELDAEITRLVDTFDWIDERVAVEYAKRTLTDSDLYTDGYAYAGRPQAARRLEHALTQLLAVLELQRHHLLVDGMCRSCADGNHPGHGRDPAWRACQCGCFRARLDRGEI